MSEQTYSTQTDLANRTENGLNRFRNYILSPEVKERFSEMMGANGIYYLNQVLILVANSEELQKCDPKSILVSAMRAASLKLSVDPGQGQAWIIPYKGKATFQLGYKGVYELALRTNLYRFINVVDVYEGEEVIENRMTGNHTLSGKRKSDKVIARMLYFQLFSGFEKTFVMTTAEIEAHAKHYSQAYNFSRSKWNDPLERPKMERKTVLVNGLRRWGRFNSADAEMINQIEEDQGWIDPTGQLPEETQVSAPAPAPKRTESDVMNELGFSEPAAAAAPAQAAQASQDAAPQGDKPWTNAVVTLEMAKSEKSKDGDLYWDMPSDQLAIRVNSIQTALDKNHLEQPKREEMMLKRDVIKSILQHRNQK